MKVSGIFYHNVCVPSWQHRKDFNDVLQVFFALFMKTTISLRKKCTNEIVQPFLPTQSNGWRCDSEKDWQVKKEQRTDTTSEIIAVYLFSLTSSLDKQTKSLLKHLFFLAQHVSTARPWSHASINKWNKFNTSHQFMLQASEEFPFKV